MTDKKSKIFVLSGPSGVGKGTVVEQVIKRVNDLYLSVSATTRKKREGEKEGVNYFFKTKKDFQDMIKNNELLEWAEFTGHYYGTPRFLVNKHLSCGKDVLLEIELEGAKQVKEKCPESVLIFLAPPSFEVLEKRLTDRRTENIDAIKLRLNKARTEMKQVNLFDYVVINDELQKAIEDVINIVKRERCKT